MPARDDSRDDLARLTELMRREPARAPGLALRPDPEPVDPLVRRRRRRRGLLIGAIATVVVLGLAGGYAGYALTAPIGSAVLDAETPEVATPAAAAVILPADGATAVSVSGADDYLGPDASGIWLASGGDEARPLASISKLVTALVVLSAKPLADASDPGPTLAFDRDDHALYDKYYLLNATIAVMPTGSTMTERDALETMLVISASNYAEAVSTWAFGSQSAFLRATRDWLAANGLTGTTMVEPTGIDPRNTSTPVDVIALGRLAMADPVVAEIVGMRSLDVPGIPFGPNTNDLLGVDGITGIKTGTLEESGSNLVFQATLDVGLPAAITVVGVVLGGYTHESVNADVRRLLAGIREGFHPVLLGRAGQEVGTYTTAWGESSRIVLDQDATALTWSDTPIDTTMTTEPVTTGRVGEEVGRITWVAGPTTQSVPLVLASSIEPPTAWWRLAHPFELGG